MADALRLQKKFPEADTQYRRNVMLRQEVVRLAGPAPANLVALADANWLLARVLLDEAETMPAGSRRRQRVEAAVNLLDASRALAQAKANAVLDPELPTEVAKQSLRAARLADLSTPR